MQTDQTKSLPPLPWTKATAPVVIKALVQSGLSVHKEYKKFKLASACLAGRAYVAENPHHVLSAARIQPGPRV